MPDYDTLANYDYRTPKERFIDHHLEHKKYPHDDEKQRNEYSQFYDRINGEKNKLYESLAQSGIYLLDNKIYKVWHHGGGLNEERTAYNEGNISIQEVGYLRQGSEGWGMFNSKTKFKCYDNSPPATHYEGTLRMQEISALLKDAQYLGPQSDFEYLEPSGYTDKQNKVRNCKVRGSIQAGSRKKNSKSKRKSPKRHSPRRKNSSPRRHSPRRS